MSVIGDKFGAYAGKVTSSTVTEAGPAVNVEADAGDLGTILYTTTFGAAVNAAGETGNKIGMTRRPRKRLPSD